MTRPLIVVVLPAATALLLGGYMLALLRTLRRHGRPDRMGEKVTAAMMVYVAARAVAAVVWPDTPGLVWALMAVPPPLIGFGFLAYRIRQFPEAVFSPRTLRRYHACKGHR